MRSEFLPNYIQNLEVKSTSITRKEIDVAALIKFLGRMCMFLALVCSVVIISECIVRWI